jgi:microcystin-dependent protein
MPLFKRKRFDSAPIFTIGDDSFVIQKADSESTGALLDIKDEAGNSVFRVTESGVIDVISTSAGSIELGASTTGDYVEAVNAGTGVTVTSGSGEGVTPTIAIGQAVGTGDSPTFAALTITGSATVGTSLIIEGTANDYKTVIVATDATADRTVTLQDASGTVALLGTIALGTDTTGSYVSDLTAGSGIIVTHTPGEGSSPTVSLDTVSRTNGIAGSKTQYIHDISTNSYGQVTEVVKSDLAITLGTQTTGDYVASLVAGTGVALANNSGETATPTISIGQAVATTDDVEFHNLTITGDLTVSGTLNTVNETNLAVEDAFIYLNDGSTITNPDLGIAGNYNDGTYKHAGMFRDATDGTFKFFQGYTEEPGADINVAHASYQDAPIKALKIELTQPTGTAPLTVSSTTKVSNLNSDLLDSQEGSWYSPPGMISMFAGLSIPDGWVLCDGQAISRTTYASLFTAIGTLYGSGDGSTTFNVPNLKGKVPVGLDSGDTSFDALGETGGHKELQAHTHPGAAHTHTGTTNTEGAHVHNYVDYTPDGGAAVNFGSQYTVGGLTNYTRTSQAGTAHSHTFTTGISSTEYTGSSGGGNAGNLQPYIVLNYIIKI